MWVQAYICVCVIYIYNLNIDTEKDVLLDTAGNLLQI